MVEGTTSVAAGHAHVPIYFTESMDAPLFSSPLGEEETISKNKETIRNPAMAAPTIIDDPNFLPLSSARLIPLPEAGFRAGWRVLNWRANAQPIPQPSGHDD